MFWTDLFMLELEPDWFIFYQRNNVLMSFFTPLRKGVVSLIFILTNPFQCYLSLSVWCVCVCVCVFCLLKPVLFEEPSLIASNQWLYDIYK